MGIQTTDFRMIGDRDVTIHCKPVENRLKYAKIQVNVFTANLKNVHILIYLM